MLDLHVGLIGAGVMAQTHLEAWITLGARVSVYSDDGRHAHLAETHSAHGVEAATSLEHLLADCALVDICTPTGSHKELILAAVAAGRHVVCEKPLAMCSDDAQEAADAAARAGVRLFPAHVVRYFPEYEALHRAVTAGTVGEPAILHFTRMTAYPDWAPWFRDDTQSGGILTDQMIHDFDFARSLVGDPVRVYAQVREIHDGHHVAAGTAVLTHASGAISYFHGLWGQPGTSFRTTFRVAGSGGVLHHDSHETTAFRVLAQPAGGEDDRIPPVALFENPYAAELRDFALTVTTGSVPRVTAHDGVMAVRIAEAARESARTGRAIDLTAEEAIR
ncbi:Gfo/Idh/MocA family oxidoreductase [Streptomyces sp. NPDC047974]|uniref:Gfo/Idh/MocA family protein n=1 Tax=Streptomyces sp. NPDC047974 TaxID=3154343 RepID=UPI0033D7E41F